MLLLRHDQMDHSGPFIVFSEATLFCLLSWSASSPYDGGRDSEASSAVEARIVVVVGTLDRSKQAALLLVALSGLLFFQAIPIFSFPPSLASTLVRR